MCRETVGRSAQRAGQHDDFRRIVAKMHMNPLCSELPDVFKDATGLHDIDQVVGKRPLRILRHTGGQSYSAHEFHRTAQHRGEGGQNQCGQSSAQHMAGPEALILVFRVGEFISPAAQCEAQNLESLALKRKDFPPNEAVAGFRIFVDEIGDFQGRKCLAG